MHIMWNGYFYQATSYHLTYLLFLLFLFVHLGFFFFCQFVVVDKTFKLYFKQFSAHYTLLLTTVTVKQNRRSEFIPPGSFPEIKLCLSWCQWDVSTAIARTCLDYLPRSGGHCKNTVVHVLNPEESASNSLVPMGVIGILIIVQKFCSTDLEKKWNI